MVNKIKNELINYSYILLGCVIMSFGIVGFLSPNKITIGGTAGLSIIFHYLFGLPTGVLMVLINLPLLLFGLKHLGKKFAFHTIITIFLIAFFVDLFSLFIHLPALSTNLLLSTLYGGIAIGLGLGLIFKAGSSAGGASIVAKIISINSSIKPSTIMLVIDAVIVISAGIVFRNIESALWSLIGIYVTSQLVEVVLTGKKYEKIVHITSENLGLLSDKIVSELGLRGTIIKGEDFNTKTKKDLILLVIETNRINVLKQLIEEVDSNAYMVIMEASELMGPTRRML